MIRFLLPIALIFATTEFLLANDYQLIIDGRAHEISLNKTHKIKLSDGRMVNVELKQKPIAHFKTKFIRFAHPVKYTPSRTLIEEGLHQTMMATPSGSVIMIQEYEGFNPAGIVDMMLNELTKEQREYGWSINTIPVSKKLVDGKTVTGKKATCTYLGEQMEVTVYGHGRRDDGLLLVVMENNLSSQEEAAAIRLFMETVELYPATAN